MRKLPRKLDGAELAKQKTYVAFVLDRSGSMNKIRDEIIGAFNEQIDTIKRESEGMQTRVSLTTFSTFVDAPAIWDAPISSIEKLTKETYRPDGMTAMLDAVGDTIERLKAVHDYNDNNVAFLVIVVSDGEENHSRRYPTFNSLAPIVKEVLDTDKWTFTYIGANQDLSQVSADLGIRVSNTAAFDASSTGVSAASNALSCGLSNYYTSRSRGITRVDDMYNQTQGDSDGQ